MVEIRIPEDAMGKVMGDLSSRRGKIQGMDMEGGFQLIKAHVPAKELYRYSSTCVHSQAAVASTRNLSATTKKCLVTPNRRWSRKAKKPSSSSRLNSRPRLAEIPAEAKRPKGLLSASAFKLDTSSTTFGALLVRPRLWPQRFELLLHIFSLEDFHFRALLQFLGRGHLNDIAGQRLGWSRGGGVSALNNSTSNISAEPGSMVVLIRSRP